MIDKNDVVIKFLAELELTEPWTARPVADRSDGAYEIVDRDGLVVVDMGGSDVMAEEEKRFAGRIAECVNACAGIPSDLLQQGGTNLFGLAGQAHAIAERGARADIECGTMGVSNLDGTTDRWYDTADVDENCEEEVKDAVKYLDARKLLLHHPVRPELVRVVEDHAPGLAAGVPEDLTGKLAAHLADGGGL